ncbi:MAG: L,D-transpeptidase family protein [Pseudomonadota bacterium]
MRAITAILLLGAALVLTGCASKFRTYNGPEVTHLVAFKSARKLVLLHNDQILREFEFELGFAPTGDKTIYGDGKTPEGLYFIDRKNPNSAFHLSLGISYPNEADRAEAAALGKSPGGDIFIHGTPRKYRGQDDWTWGCLAVTDREMEDLFAMVAVGTPITITP